MRVTDKGNENDGRISLDKTSTDRSDATLPAAPEDAAAAAVPRPKQIPWAVAALVVSGLAALGASLSLLGLHGFLVHQLTVANNKLKPSDRKTSAEVLHTASIQPGISAIQSALFLVVLLFVARAVWRGRYWSRWAVIGLWILATFTGIYGGLLQITAIAANAPIALKVPIFLSSISMLAAVVLIAVVRPVTAWLNLTKPARPEPGAAPPRRGLFSAPRDTVRADRQGLPASSPVGSRKMRETAARTDDLFRGDSNTERARAKQRMSTENRQRDVNAARARAKASKSRRPGS